MVRLPVEYQEVEYLECAGTQYIKTNYTPTVTEDMKIEMDYMFTVNQSGDSFLFGAKASGTSPITFQGECYDNRWFCGSGLYQFRSVLGNVGTSLNKRHSFIIDGNVLKVDDNSASSTKTQSDLYSVPLYIFAGNWNEATSFINKGARIYNLSFTANRVKEADFIPCYRKSDSEPGMYDTVSGVFFTNAGTGTFIVGNDVSWDTASLIERRRQILINTPHIATESANPLTFKTDISANLKDCKIYFEPIQEGSGDPSPDNVRPISGWDGVTVTRTGKNLFVNQNGARCYVGMKAGVTYAVSYNASSNAYFRGYDENGDYVTGIIWMNAGIVNERRYGTITPSIDIPYGSIYVGTGVSEAQIEVGSAPTSYEPYTGTSITIPFPQTIYGGYVDLVKGEVVEEWKFITLNGDENWSFSSSWSNDSVYCVYDNNSYNDALFSDYNGIYTMCDQLISGSRNACYSGALKTLECISFSGISTAPKLTIKLSKSRVSSVDDVKAYLVEHTPMVAYKLATPITHQLTPQTIKTLKGINNIWSDANGDVEVKFWKH